MITQLRDVKFKVTAGIEGFSLSDDDFAISVKNTWGQEKYKFAKSDMFQDDNGDYYFLLENVQQGTYYAILTAFVPDGDYSARVRKEIDVQPLNLAGDQTNWVIYGRTTDIDLKYLFLLESDSLQLLDSEGNKLEVLRS